MNKTILIFGALVAMAFGAAAQEANEVEIVTDENVRLEIITPAQPVQETEQDVKAREKKMRELKDDVAYAKHSTRVTLALTDWVDGRPRARSAILASSMTIMVMCTCITR